MGGIVLIYLPSIPLINNGTFLWSVIDKDVYVLSGFIDSMKTAEIQCLVAFFIITEYVSGKQNILPLDKYSVFI